MITVHDYPAGYSKFAAYQACDPSLLVFRKFDWLRNSVLLDLQDELQALEESFEEHLKWENDHDGSRKLKSRRLDYRMEGSRLSLIQEIKAKLEEYGK